MTWSIDIIEVAVIPDLPLTIYFPDADPAARLDVPCYCYLLTGGGQPIMVDTGPDRIVAARSGFTVRGDARQAIAVALSRRSLSFSDIHIVVQSHLHYDHMQNTSLFSAASVLVQQREVERACSANPSLFYVGVPQFVEALGDRLRVVQGEIEVVSGITLVLNGGHSPGHQSVLVETDEGTTCLCIDIIPMATNMEIIPRSMDEEATRAFVKRVRDEGWKVIPGHDPLLRQHVWYVSPVPSKGDSRHCRTEFVR